MPNSSPSALPAELQQLRPYAQQGLRLEEVVRVYLHSLAQQPPVQAVPSPLMNDLQATFDAWIATLPAPKPSPP
jgi:hypothetical protein